jgi:hypothetical protein
MLSFRKMLIYDEATRLMFATGIHADFRKQDKLTKIQTSIVYATGGCDESLRFLLNVIDGEAEHT